MFMTLPMYIVYWVFTHAMFVLFVMALIIGACAAGACHIAFGKSKLIDILCHVVGDDGIRGRTYLQ